MAAALDHILLTAEVAEPAEVKMIFKQYNLSAYTAFSAVRYFF